MCWSCTDCVRSADTPGTRVRSGRSGQGRQTTCTRYGCRLCLMLCLSRIALRAIDSFIYSCIRNEKYKRAVLHGYFWRSCREWFLHPTALALAPAPDYRCQEGPNTNTTTTLQLFVSLLCICGARAHRIIGGDGLVPGAQLRIAFPFVCVDHMPTWAMARAAHMGDGSLCCSSRCTKTVAERQRHSATHGRSEL